MPVGRAVVRVGEEEQSVLRMVELEDKRDVNGTESLARLRTPSKKLLTRASDLARQVMPPMPWIEEQGTSGVYGIREEARRSSPHHATKSARSLASLSSPNQSILVSHVSRFGTRQPG
jgi:hypothetical protein